MYVRMDLSLSLSEPRTQRVVNVGRERAQVFRGLIHLKAMLHPVPLGDQPRGSFSLDNPADRFPHSYPEPQLRFVILFILAPRG